MFKLLEHLFINKKYPTDEVTNDKRSAYGTLTSIVGIVCNLILCTLKILAGILSGSISLTADGINNLTDSAASITTLVGFKLAKAPADGKHPFGHERIEYICGMFISLFILVVGILLGKESITKIIASFKGEGTIDVSQFYLLAGIMVASILVKCWMAYVYKTAGKKINSVTIMAACQDSLNDCISTAVVLVSLIVAKIWPNIAIDGWLGLSVAIFILFNGVKLTIETMSPLIGEAPDEEHVKELLENILSHEGVLGVHDLVIHSYGPGKLFMTIHIEVDSQADLMESHEMIDNIEREFMDKYGIEMTGHLDPIDTRDEFTNNLRNIVAEIIASVEGISFHDFRIVKGPHNTNVLFDIVRPYDCKLSDSELIELLNVEFREKAKKLGKMQYHLIIDIDNVYAK